MKFEVIPILSFMESLYSRAISPLRFQEYLSKLQGDSKDDLVIPIMGFNPMAKEHLLQKVRLLQAFKAEALAVEALQSLNLKLHVAHNLTLKLVLNVADDLKGAWTNFYTTDFDSKFKFKALIDRNFCTPYFWSSEEDEHYNESLIKQRVQEYALRTIYWLDHTKPIKLEDHLKQELFVCTNTRSISPSFDEETFKQVEAYYKQHKSSEDYSVLFNFFYGDKASASLNYPCYGIESLNGFEFANILAHQAHQ